MNVADTVDTLDLLSAALLACDWFVECSTVPLTFVLGQGRCDWFEIAECCTVSLTFVLGQGDVTVLSECGAKISQCGAVPLTFVLGQRG